MGRNKQDVQASEPVSKNWGSHGRQTVGEIGSISFHPSSGELGYNLQPF